MGVAKAEWMGVGIGVGCFTTRETRDAFPLRAMLIRGELPSKVNEDNELVAVDYGRVRGLGVEGRV